MARHRAVTIRALISNERSKQTRDLSIEAYRVDRITFQQLIDNYKTLLRHRLDDYRRLSQREQTLATLERVLGCAITTWSVELKEIPASSTGDADQVSITGAIPTVAICRPAFVKANRQASGSDD